MGVEDKNEFTKKNLKIILIVLGSIISILILGIIIINLSNKTPTTENAISTDPEIQEIITQSEAAMENESDARKAELYIAQAFKLSTHMKKTGQDTCDYIRKALSKAKELDNTIPEEVKDAALNPCPEGKKSGNAGTGS